MRRRAGIDARLQLKGRMLFDAAAGRIELARIDGVLEGSAWASTTWRCTSRATSPRLARERTLSAENVVVSSMHKSGLTVFNTVLAAPELKWSEYRLSGSSATIDASVAHPDRTTTLALKVPTLRVGRARVARHQRASPAHGQARRLAVARARQQPAGAGARRRAAHRTGGAGDDRAAQPSRAGRRPDGASCGARSTSTCSSTARWPPGRANSPAPT